MTITLREEKGSPLTHEEMDNNAKYLSGCLNMNSFLHIQDQKPQGTHGGTFTSGAWRTRDLNTVLTNTITGASLSNNQIILPAGKYYVEASAPSCLVRQNKASLYNVTGAVTLLIGTLGHSGSSSFGSLHDSSLVYGEIGLSEESDVELRHICRDTTSNHGFGNSHSLGVFEVYSDIRIWRIGEYGAP